MTQQTFANPKLRDLPVEVRLRPPQNLFIGIALRVLSILIPPTGVVLMVLNMLTLGALMRSFFIFLLLFFTALISIRLYRLSARYLINPAGELQHDSRAPILYLRSFYDDYEEVSDRFDKKTPEEILTATLQMVGPVIAIGMPEESDLPLLGARRIYVKNDNAKWQDVVEKLISASQMVVMHAGTTPGVDWELQAAQRLVDQPQKLLITFLMWQEQGTGKSSSLATSDWAYGHFAAQFKKTFGHDLPPIDNQTSFVYFESNWTPRTIKLSAKRALLDIAVPWVYKPNISIPAKSITNAVLGLLDQRELLEPAAEYKPGMDYLWLFFSMRGRINRLTFWLRGILPLTIVYVLVRIVLQITGFDFLSSLLFLFVVWPLLALSVKRVHDFGIAAWATVPVVLCTNIFAIPILGLVKGNSRFNSFGLKGI